MQKLIEHSHVDLVDAHKVHRVQQQEYSVHYRQSNHVAYQRDLLAVTLQSLVTAYCI